MKRSWNYLSFALSSAFIGLFLVKKPDVIYVFHAPATIAIPALLFKLILRSKIVYDINDYWPDSLLATGMVNNKELLKIIHAYCRMTYRFFDHINVVTAGYKQKLIKDGVAEGKISVIYNWPHPYGFEESAIFKKHKNIFQGEISVLYAGNMGKAQNLTILLDAAQSLDVSQINIVKFIFVGDGLMKNNLRELAGNRNLKNVYFIDKVPLNELGHFLEATTFHFLHLKKDPLFQITIPSKLFSCLHSGKPIISGVSGETNGVVNEAHAGITFESDDKNGLVSALQKALVMSEEERNLLGKNGYDFFKDNFSFESGSKRFNDIFIQLINNSTGDSI
jgi:colanic acid biosynthesis glycosyl transferase WcaI